MLAHRVAHRVWLPRCFNSNHYIENKWQSYLITSCQKGLCGLRVHDEVSHLLLSQWFQVSLKSIYWLCIDYFLQQTAKCGNTNRKHNSPALSPISFAVVGLYVLRANKRQCRSLQVCKSRCQICRTERNCEFNRHNDIVTGDTGRCLQHRYAVTITCRCRKTKTTQFDTIHWSLNLDANNGLRCVILVQCVKRHKCNSVKQMPKVQ